jgi:hypothetical protein
MDLKAGTRLQSSVCSTEVIVVRPPSTPVDLRCGGIPMRPVGDPAASAPLDSASGGGTLLGKRYSDPASGLELLCTKAGEGSLSVASEPLELKNAKPLPSSD